MNITYLIGNGFDLGLGLKTRFSDFFPVYIEKKTASSNILEFKKRIQDDIENWSDFELELGKYTKEFGEEQNEVDRFLDQKEDFDLEFFRYLEDEQNKSVIDNAYLKKFADNLYWYNNFANPLLRDEPATIIRSMLGRDINANYFITFNYTDCLEKIIKQINKQQLLNERRTLVYGKGKDKIESVIYAHGKIGKSPIIGVNDKSQIENAGFNNNLELTELLVKHEIDTNSDQGFERKAVSVIDKSDIICIYGMSLGDTDNQWWEHLINWLDRDLNHYLIIFDYDKNYIDSERRYRKKKLKIRERFAEFLDSPSSSLLDRILCIIHKNIFEMDLTTPRELEKEVASTEDNIKRIRFITAN